MTKPTYCYSADEGEYQFYEEYEAVDSAEPEMGDTVTVYRGILKPYKASELLGRATESLLERITDMAYYMIEDHAETWNDKFGAKLGVLDKELKIFLDDFCKRHACEPDFALITKVQEAKFKVTQVEPELEYEQIGEWK